MCFGEAICRFERVPLCDVDALLLSYLSYMPYDQHRGG